jgi:hypothetical protein
MAPDRSDTVTDLILSSINEMRTELRSLRDKGDEGREIIRREVSELRHATNNQLTSIRPLVEAHTMQVKAHTEQIEAQSAQLKAHSTQLDVQAKGLKQLTDRPEHIVNRSILWLALAVGLGAAVGGDLIIVVARMFVGMLSG